MAIVRQLQLVGTWEEEIEIIGGHIRSIAAPNKCMRILEAGCGQAWPLNLAGLDYCLTGLDLDEAALRIRLDQTKDLHAAIHGDLRSVDIEEGSFDVIYSSFVLEHIEGAAAVMDRFARWLSPGGLIVLRLPDPQSVQGFMTRVTPHWFHVFYYRHLLNQSLAGTAGHAPYPVFYDPVIWRDGMTEYCATKGLEILAEYGDGYVRPGKGVKKAMIASFKVIVSILSFGRLSCRHTNLLYVLKKQ